MKEFDYEQAKAGKPVCTRSGWPARIICWDCRHSIFEIVALIGGSEQEAHYYRKDGSCDPFDVDLDLMMSEKVSRWQNIYHNKDYPECYESSKMFLTEEEARNHIEESIGNPDYWDYVKTIEVVLKEH